jgi:hypothetical protein
MVLNRKKMKKNKKNNKKNNKGIVINLNFFTLKPVKENIDTMVLSTRRPRDRVKTSGIAKKKEKNNYKGHKKGNYKKKDNVVSFVECSICFNKVSNTYDNSVKCGKTTHFICGECKFRCNETGNDKCPMCRSHPIRNPIARDVVLTVIKGERLKKPNCPYLNINMSPKLKRSHYRSQGRLVLPFNYDSNRIVRERSGTGRSGRPDRSLYYDKQLLDPVPFGWRKWIMRGGSIHRGKARVWQQWMLDVR